MGWGKTLTAIILASKFVLGGMAVAQLPLERPHNASFGITSGEILRYYHIPDDDPYLQICNNVEGDTKADGVVYAEEYPQYVSGLTGAAWALQMFQISGWRNASRLNSARIFVLKTLGEAYFDKYLAEVHNLGFLHEGDVKAYHDYLLPELMAFCEQRAAEEGLSERYAMFNEDAAIVLEHITRAVEMTAGGIDEGSIPARGAIARGVLGSLRVPDYYWSYEEQDGSLDQIVVYSYVPWIILSVMNNLNKTEVDALIKAVDDLRIAGYNLCIEAGDVKVLFDRQSYAVVFGPYEENF